MSDDLEWEQSAQKNFDKMIEKIPLPLRNIAKENVLKKIKELLTNEQRELVEEKDLIDGFFQATPGGFHGPMKVDMEAIGLDYRKYGYEKDEWKSIFGIKKDENKEN